MLVAWVSVPLSVAPGAFASERVTLADPLVALPNASINCTVTAASVLPAVVLCGWAANASPEAAPGPTVIDARLVGVGRLVVARTLTDPTSVGLT